MEGPPSREGRASRMPACRPACRGYKGESAAPHAGHAGRMRDGMRGGMRDGVKISHSAPA
jgi:hypothetical protein